MKDLNKLLKDCQEIRNEMIMKSEDSHPVSADDMRDIIHYLCNLHMAIIVIADDGRRMVRIAEAWKK